MARVSFTLRRTAAEQGSHLRYGEDDHGARVDYDSALRADGLQIAPPDFVESFFSAVPVCYGEVALKWGVDIATTPGPAPAVSAVVVVYSPTGEPQTITSGDVVVESSDTFDFVHRSAPEGKWAYYSMFVHYTSTGGDSYFERVASLGTLVPRNYGSTMSLWNRIPAFYRNQDTAMGDSSYSPCLEHGDGASLPGGGNVGPLYKYLSIIGFDIDRIRTTLDYTMVAKDPRLAHTQALDALAEQMAVTMTGTDLGTSRLRAVMDDIGVFRRTKGTVSGTEFYGKAVSGGNIEIDQDSKEIRVFSQRVNYITSPIDGAGIVSVRAAHESEVASPLDFSDTTHSGSTVHSVSGSTYSPTGTGATGVTHLMVRLSSPVPVKLNDRVGFGVHSGTGANQIKWVRLVAADETEMGFETDPALVDGSPVFEAFVFDGASTSAYTDCFVEFLVDLQAPIDISSLIAERNFLGSYFDGSFTRGGWLIDSTSVSDFRWAGSANSSVSLYAEDYERTKGILQALLFEVFPVTEAYQYSIVEYDAVPGF